jgi:hypothetical protein
MALVLSPTGIALYVGFWIFKILFGVWILRKMALLLPVHWQDRLAARFSFLRLDVGDNSGPRDWMR